MRQNFLRRRPKVLCGDWWWQAMVQCDECAQMSDLCAPVLLVIEGAPLRPKYWFMVMGKGRMGRALFIRISKGRCAA